MAVRISSILRRQSLTGTHYLLQDASPDARVKGRWSEKIHGTAQHMLQVFLQLGQRKESHTCPGLEANQHVNVATIRCLIPRCRAEYGDLEHAEPAAQCRQMLVQHVKHIFTAHRCSPRNNKRPHSRARSTRYAMSALLLYHDRLIRRWAGTSDSPHPGP